MIILLQPFTAFLVFAAFVVEHCEQLQVQRQSSSCFEGRDKGTTDCDQPKNGIYFYYDKVMHICQPFLYAGCDGNANRFESAQICAQICTNAYDDHLNQTAITNICESKARAASASNGTLVRCRSNGSKCPQGYKCDRKRDFCCPTKEYLCALPYDAGTSDANGLMSTRFFYDSKLHNCMLFTYLGKLGNANNFVDYNDCIAFCK